jgi:hypothetical protein
LSDDERADWLAFEKLGLVEKIKSDENIVNQSEKDDWKALDKFGIFQSGLPQITGWCNVPSKGKKFVNPTDLFEP